VIQACFNFHGEKLAEIALTQRTRVFVHVIWAINKACASALRVKRVFAGTAHFTSINFDAAVSPDFE
jgi:hypothetical protein